jgi:hypothetical protein
MQRWLAPVDNTRLSVSLCRSSTSSAPLAPGGRNELTVSVSRSAHRSVKACCLRSLQQWVNLALQHGDHLGRQDSGAETCRHMGEEYKAMQQVLTERRVEARAAASPV